jgi:hypothetical protein
MKKWHVTLLFLAIGICLAVGLRTVQSARPGVTKVNFDRIQIGMTLEEVEKILGQPRDERSTPPLFVWFGEKDTDRGPEAYMFLEIADNRVIRKDEWVRPPPTLSYWLWRWFDIGTPDEKRGSTKK